MDGQTMTRLTMVADNPDWEMLYSLPPDRTYIYYLNPAMNYAVRRAEERYDSTLLLATDNEQFEELAGRNIWLPHKSTTHYYTAQMLPGKYFSEPILAETFEMTELSLKPVSDDQFVLQPPAGAQIFDQAGGTMTAAQKKGPAGSAAQGVLAHVASVESTPTGMPIWRWIIAGIAGVAAVVLVGVGVSKYRRAANGRA